jgi:UrcA family protein
MTMFKQAIAPALAVLATVTVFSIPQAAMAQEAGKSVEVRFADLNLNTAEGQQKLERRIDRAARQVCAMDQMTTGSRIASPAASACYRLALRNVRDRVASVISNSSSGG